VQSVKKYDVIIVGCGPAGIFTAIELIKHAKDKFKILMIDKGADIEERKKTRDYLCGWGGAGAFADGKVNLTHEIGGWLNDILAERELKKLIMYVDKIWQELAPESIVYMPDDDAVAELKMRARRAHLKLISYPTRHIGTDKTAQALFRAKKMLEPYVEIKLKTEVKRILVEDNKVTGIELSDGEKIHGRYVVVAPGRSGAKWFVSEVRRLGIPLRINPVDIGVRVEVLSDVLAELTDIQYEPKLIYYSKTFDDKVRTFCVNPYGFVVKERYEDIVTVNGHSYQNKKSDNTNFAILVTSYFTWPFKDPIEYGKSIARLANLLSGGSVLVQRLGDLLRGRRSTPERISRSAVEPTLTDAIPGDISYALPHRILTDILEMLEALNKIAPGVYSDHTLLYAVEVKFYSARVDVTTELEAKGIRNLFAIGDGAGITRSLAQASASGVIAARAILRREGLLKESLLF